MQLSSPLEIDAPTVALIDNRDSFTPNLAHALCAAGATVEIVDASQADADEVRARAVAGFVISAGPCSPREAGVSTPLIAAWLEANDPRPLLGVCLGHQCIAAALGGGVTRAARPLHGAVEWVRHDGRGLFAGAPQPVAMARYNSLTVDPSTLPAPLEVSARGPDGAIMALRHRHRPLVGLQFHPESHLSTDGEALLARWVVALSSRRGSLAGAAEGGHGPPP